jgi:hypothetical protein
MTFDEVLEKALALLQRRGRISYRALKLQFDLDDDALADLQEELLYAHHPVADEDGRASSGLGRLEARPRHPHRTSPPPAHRVPLRRNAGSSLCATSVRGGPCHVSGRLFVLALCLLSRSAGTRGLFVLWPTPERKPV